MFNLKQWLLWLTTAPLYNNLFYIQKSILNIFEKNKKLYTRWMLYFILVWLFNSLTFRMKLIKNTISIKVVNAMYYFLQDIFPYILCQFSDHKVLSITMFLIGKFCSTYTITVIYIYTAEVNVS